MIDSFQGKKKIVFLYTELAGYFLACISRLINSHDAEVFIFHYPVNDEAPFKFNFSEKVNLFNKKDFGAEALLHKIEAIAPDLIYCSGWIDKDYLKVCRKFRNKIPVVVGLDNQWKNTFRQKLATLLAPFTILKYFSHCWVPGERQKEYALKLGFKENKIRGGVYSADADFFNQLYLQNRKLKEEKFPKRFIYAGRYYEFKGIKDLWRAFAELQQEEPNEWELWCLGTGDVKPLVHPKIKHFGFIQPEDIATYIAQTGVFVLPSHFEPWGVVVHEFAAAGFPLVCSDEVGSCTAFLQHQYNGYVYPSANVDELKKILKKIMHLPVDELLLMSERSREKAMQITPGKWADLLINIMHS